MHLIFQYKHQPAVMTRHRPLNHLLLQGSSLSVKDDVNGYNVNVIYTATMEDGIQTALTVLSSPTYEGSLLLLTGHTFMHTPQTSITGNWWVIQKALIWSVRCSAGLSITYLPLGSPNYSASVVEQSSCIWLDMLTSFHIALYLTISDVSLVKFGLDPVPQPPLPSSTRSAISCHVK